MKKRCEKKFCKLFFILATVVISGFFLGSVSAEGGVVLFHEVLNKFVDVPDLPYTTPTITTQHLVRATNTKDYWERFTPERRGDYLKSESKDALKKQLTAKQLTYEEQLRRIIKDNKQVWDNIKTDSNKQRTNGVLENILKADDRSLSSVDLTKSKLTDSEFLKKDLKDIFSYGKEKGKIFTSDLKIKKLKFDELNIHINENYNDQITINSGQFYGGESIPESRQIFGDSSGRIERPFDNIEASGRNKKTAFFKDKDDFNISLSEDGEFWITDSKLVINGKLEDNEERKPGDIKFIDVLLNGLKTGSSQNINATLYLGNEEVAIIHFPLSPPNSRTEFMFDPISGYPVLDAFSEPDSYSILSSSQYVHIVKYNLGLKGDKIVVDVLKPFDKLNCDGTSLSILNGETYMTFQGKNMYYPRTIEKNDFFINLITNKQDVDTYFALTPVGSKGNYLIDNKRRTSVGDFSVENPKIKGIKIAQIREEMWMR
ncbi:MAG: hypothetical protein WC979_09325 [Candidatus Pacearchaeota archaeon]|jgi:hypothetical protein